MNVVSSISPESGFTNLHSNDGVRFTPFGHFVRKDSAERGRIRRGSAFTEIDTSRSNTIRSIRASLRRKRKENARQSLLAPSNGSRDGVQSEKGRDVSPCWVEIWWPEIMALLVMLGSFLGIVAVLASRQNKSQHTWPKSITLNATISILSTTMKATMTLIVAQGLSQLKWDWFKVDRRLQDVTKFDRASRGPLGSIQLLVGLKGRRIMATVGALVMVIVLAVDPFVQQIIRHSECSSISTTEQVSIPRTNMFQASDASVMTSAMRATMHAGLALPNADYVPMSCPGSDCEFPDIYHTVGYCSSCRDISEDVMINSILTVLNGEVLHENIQTSLPSGFSVTTEYLSPRNGTVFAIAPAPDGSSYEFLLGDQRVNAENSSAKSTCWNQHSNGTFYCLDAGAASCTVSPCIKSYKARMKNGIVQEELVETSAQWGTTPGGSFQESVYLPCLNKTQLEAVQQAGYNITNDTFWLAYQRSFDPQTRQWTTGSNTSDVVPTQCLYQISLSTERDVKGLMDDYLNGFIMDDGKGHYSGPPHIQAFFNSTITSFDSINSLMANMTNAMTSYVRQNGVAGFDSSAPGTVFSPDICTHVEWAWIALPAALVLLTTLFLICVIFKSTRSPILRREGGDWKSSPLPLIFRGLGNEPVQQERSMHHMTDFERAARDLRVRLIASGANGSGLHFV